MALTAEELKKMKPDELKAALDQLHAQTAILEFEQAQENYDQMKARKAQRSRENAQRQSQLRKELQEKAAVIKSCSHRQGGSPGRERQGKGPSALRVAIMPQEERRVIMCANCPLRVWEPSKLDANKRQRKGETSEDAKQRVEAHFKAVEEFEALIEKAQDQPTPEAATPMHSGKTFNFSDAEGNTRRHSHPCDSYAQGTDNRRIA